MKGNCYILVINPGSTSTKLAIFNGKESLIEESVTHSLEEIKKFNKIYDQKDMRTSVVLNWVKEKGFSVDQFSAVVGRGGLIRPIPGGTYYVTEKMINDLKIGYQGEHASNLGGIIAHEIASKANIPSFIVDPVSVDEFTPVARISGLPEIPRRSLVHSLNIKAVTRKVCEDLKLDFYNSSFVVAHLGGGISIVPLENGRILDSNNAKEEGPFSPDRVGGLPTGDLIKLAYSGKYTLKELQKKMSFEGGLIAYIGTNNGIEILNRIKAGDKKAEFIVDAMGYQIGKEIGAMATVLNGNVDRIILTGGLAYNTILMDYIKNMVSFIAEVEIVPGEEELLALAQGAYRVVNGEEKAKIYEDEVGLID